MIERADVEDYFTRAPLSDGREVAIPLAGSQRLAFELVSGGGGVRWPALDEGLSVSSSSRTRTCTGAKVGYETFYAPPAGVQGAAALHERTRQAS